MRLLWCLVVACVVGAAAVPERLDYDEAHDPQFEQATGRLAVARRDATDMPELSPCILVDAPPFALRVAGAWTWESQLVTPPAACAGRVFRARGPPIA